MPDKRSLVRQWTLLRTLATCPHGRTIRELAEQTGVCERTIRRDIELLRELDFPLQESTHAHGLKRWRIEPDWQRMLSFDLTEAAALYLGRQFLEPLAGTYFWDGAQSAFRKLRGAFCTSARQYLEQMGEVFHHTAVGAGDYSQRGELIDRLMIAAEDGRVIELTYATADGDEPTTFAVHPCGLIYHRHSLYLVAFAPHRSDYRHYKVDRIRAAELADDRFTRPADFDLREYLEHSFGVYRGDGRLYDIRIRFLPDGGAARYVSESHWHPSEKLSPQPDGSLIAEFRLGDLEEVRKWILSFGPNAIALDPPELREATIQDLQRTLDQYRSNA